LTYFVKYLVRKIFQEKLGIGQDDDIVDHEPASPDEVRAFANGQGTGPNPENLHFDMEGTLTSVWNRRSFEILANQLGEECEEGEIPTRSDQYRMNLIEEKFKRLRTIWNRGVPRGDDSGIFETPEEVEKRLEASKQEQLKRARKTTRRHAVSIDKLRIFSIA
jgi:hypothetical protein